ncbi:unnamed protein product [Rodentolepis nana]|uniref:SH3 domain-containing protein n=1 Tax=Rodentolepis nana TaxID=102285 RepID=A0A0R3TTJ0_RODNA|nr:unnamed protein product [Rodentolepis nana]
MGSQHAKPKKGSSDTVDKNIIARSGKGKRTKCTEDGTSVSSLDLTQSLDGDVLAISDYDPPLNCTGSTIAVRKGDSLLVYGQSPSGGDWLDVLCRRTGSGQYGVVYEAIFKPYDVTVAVKTLKIIVLRAKAGYCMLIKPYLDYNVWAWSNVFMNWLLVEEEKSLLATR